MRAYTLTVSGSTVLSGSVVPEGSGSHDLGSATNPFKDLHIMSSSIHMYDTTGPIAKLGAIRGRGFEFKDHTGALTRITGSHMKLSGDAKVVGTVTAGEFSGGGAGLTGVTAEWDGTHTGNGVITGTLSAGHTSTTFWGDANYSYTKSTSGHIIRYGGSGDNKFLFISNVLYPIRCIQPKNSPKIRRIISYHSLKSCGLHIYHKLHRPLL